MFSMLVRYGIVWRRDPVTASTNTNHRRRRSDAQVSLLHIGHQGIVLNGKAASALNVHHLLLMSL